VLITVLTNHFEAIFIRENRARCDTSALHLGPVNNGGSIYSRAAAHDAGRSRSERIEHNVNATSASPTSRAVAMDESGELVASDDGGDDAHALFVQSWDDLAKKHPA